uniref:Si:dkey-148a17.5 n=1 Tax=Oryzias melastigma TaxID=30732 RepID=A0A3B3DHF3_ORYME
INTSNFSKTHNIAPEEYGTGTAVACVILGLSFLIGVPGNLFVIWTILRSMKRRSHTVMLILHLAVADTVVLITLPLWIYSMAHTWEFGEGTCKALVYFISTCMYSSIFFITLMSVERFVAISHPFVMLRWGNKSFMNRFLLFLWLLAFSMGTPAILTQSLNETDGVTQCFFREFSSDTQAIIIVCLETVAGFVLPLIILSICSCHVSMKIKKLSFNSKPKSVVLVHAVVIAFILCWLPHHIINIIDVVCLLISDTEHEYVPEYLVFSSGALVFISSSVNPMLYAFFAKNFRGSLEGSRLVRLFQEMTTYTNKLRDLAVQQQSEQGPSTQEEFISDSTC